MKGCPARRDSSQSWYDLHMFTAHLVQELVLTCPAQQRQCLEDSEHERWITHQGREGCDQPLQVSVRDVSRFRDAMGAAGQQRPQFS